MSRLRPRDVAVDQLDDAFWDGCLRQQFLVHRCAECGRSYWPASSCIDHGSASMEWRPASGLGEVFTYTIVHHVYDPDLADRVPYCVAVVKLDEGPFFHTDIVNCKLEDIHVGLRVHVTFEAIDDETALPHFAPVSTRERRSPDDPRPTQ
jgi:uncharacterized OB-fold protein